MAFSRADRRCRSMVDGRESAAAHYDFSSYRRPELVAPAATGNSRVDRTERLEQIVVAAAGVAAD